MRNRISLILIAMIAMNIVILGLIACASPDEHIHSYFRSDIIYPTCTQDGYSVYECSCGDSYNGDYVQAFGHELKTDAGVDPTCLADGLSDGAHCVVCGKIITAQQVIPAKGHTKVKDESVAPTCTTDGLTEGTHCDVCGDIIVAQQVVPAKGHTKVKDESVAPTCTTDGLTEGIHCDVCGDIIVAQQVIPATDHKWEEWNEVEPATCTTEGIRKRLCANDQNHVETQKIDKLPHNSSGWIVDSQATCQSQGSEHRECTCCHCKIESRIIEPLGHDLQYFDGKEATCTENGYDAYCVCRKCTYTTYKEIPALGHDIMSFPERNATCTQAGWSAYEACSRCDYSTYSEIPASGHKFGEWEVHRTHCDQSGERIRTCNVCKYVDKQIIAAGQHSWNEGRVIKEPTCTVEGEKLYACTLCNKTRAESIAATGHTEVTDGYIAPTCTSSGMTAGTHCSVCKQIIVPQQIIPAIDHTPATAIKTNVVEPTCSSEGGYDEVINCSICGVLITNTHKTIDKVAHCESDWITDIVETCQRGGSKHTECTVCHIVIKSEQTEALEHSLIEHEEKAPTCTDQGYGKYYTCSYCDYTTLEIKEALGHDFVGRVCTRCGLTQASEGLKFDLSADESYYIVAGQGECVDKAIIIPETINGKPIKEIGAEAFKNSTITSVTIPDSIISIGESAFADCAGLVNIAIGNGVQFIGYGAFQNSAYYNDGNNRSGGVLYIGNYLIAADTALSGEYTIRQGTTLIAVYAFGSCDKITTIVIPDSVVYVGNEAFFACRSLERVVLGKNVCSIGTTAFSSCKTLKEVYYCGNADEWAKISIGKSNSYLLNASIYYYSETPPANSDKCWRYVDGIITLW